MSEYRSIYTASRALVVGINSYSDPRFMTLGQAEDDARAFGDLLAAPPYNFQVDRLIGRGATRNAILQALFTLRRSDPDDRILIYFAGHGYTLSDLKGSESGYLACVDTVPEQDFTALKLDDVIDLTHHARAKHICFIFDACFSGQALGLTRAPAVAADKLMMRRAYHVMTAGAGDQTVADYQSMTARMIDALNSGVLQTDGITTVNELGLYVQQAIMRESANNQIPQFGHVRGSQGGDFVFYFDTRLTLPDDLEEALRTSRANTRLGAVVDLIELARSEEEIAPVAQERLVRIAAEDGDARVRKAAQRYLDGADVLLKGTGAPKARSAPPAPAAAQRGIDILKTMHLPRWLAAAAVVIVAAIIIGLIALVRGSGSTSDLVAHPTRPALNEEPTGQAAPAGQSGVITPEATDVLTGATAGHSGRIAFVSKRDGNPEIYVSNNDGSLTRLTDNPADDITPAWSPDGSRIAFASNRDGNFEIFVMNADGSGLARLTYNSDDDYWPVWSPNGAWLVFDSNRSGPYQLYSMNADGSQPVLLSGNMANAFWPSISPDGQAIAFVSIQDGNYELYKMNVLGTDIKRLTNTPGDEITPAWSPDGTKIAYGFGPQGQKEIYVMDAGGGGITRLTSHPENESIPRWSPDGSQIAFATNRDGNYEIYVMHADGGNLFNITNNSFSDDAPSWGP